LPFPALQILNSAMYQSINMAPRPVGAPVSVGQPRQAATISQRASAPTIGGVPRYSQSPLATSAYVGGYQGRPVQGVQARPGATRTVVGARPSVTTQGAYASRSVMTSAPVVANGPPTVVTRNLGAPKPSSVASTPSSRLPDNQLEVLKNIRASSGFRNVPVGPALQALKAAGKANGGFNQEDFSQAYCDLMESYDQPIPSVDMQSQVFNLFDRDGNAFVDMLEMACSSSLLCRGNEEDKIHAVFDVFDDDGDGFISKPEMIKFLSSVYKVVLTPKVVESMSVMGVDVFEPEHLAEVTATECFNVCDIDKDGRLNVNEFKQWFFAPQNDPSFMFSPMKSLLS